MAGKSQTKFSIIKDGWVTRRQVNNSGVSLSFYSQFFYTESSPDPDPTVGIQAQNVSAISENQLNASLDGDHSSAGNSSSVPSRINGTYANFTTYNHARSSTVVSPENGNIALYFIIFVFIMA